MKTLLAIPLIGIALVIALMLMLTRPRTSAAKVPGPPTCTVPTGGASTAPPTSAVDGTFAGVRLSPAQVATVQKVIGVAKGLTVTRRGATVAIQTAMQESTLDPSRDNGHALGLFQQIAPGPFNAYVGYDPHDAAAAVKGFFTVLLKRAPGYDSDSRSNAELAELVEASGEGFRYAQWQGFAEAVTAALYDGSGPPLDCTVQSVTGPIPIDITGNQVTLPPQAGVKGVITAASPQIAKAIGSGLAWLGTTYAWGGGDANGPTKGTTDNGGEADAHGDYNKIGFDCAGLTLYSYAQAGVTLTKPSGSQLTNARLVVPYAQGEPGDLLFWGTHHVAMYLGVIAGQHLMLEAPQSGDVVKVSPVRAGDTDFRGVAARPIPGR